MLKLSFFVNFTLLLMFFFSLPERPFSFNFQIGRLSYSYLFFLILLILFFFISEELCVSFGFLVTFIFFIYQFLNYFYFTFSQTILFSRDQNRSSLILIRDKIYNELVLVDFFYPLSSNFMFTTSGESLDSHLDESFSGIMKELGLFSKNNGVFQSFFRPNRFSKSIFFFYGSQIYDITFFFTHGLHLPNFYVSFSNLLNFLRIAG